MYKKLKRKVNKMSRYFTDEEFQCHGEREDNIERFGSPCGCGGSLGPNGISQDLKDLLTEIRETVGRPVHINCAYRCPVHDARVGGIGGAHTQGTAADIWVDNMPVDELADLATELGADGVGRYYNDEFVHVDVRDGRTGTKYEW